MKGVENAMKEERIDRELEKVRGQMLILQNRERELQEQKDAIQMARTIKTIEKSQIPLPDIIAMIKEKEAENRRILKTRGLNRDETEACN